MPTTELDARFSSPGATPSDWSTATDALERSEAFWLTTVRPDGRPHVTPLIALWDGGSLWFCTGPEEQKARNLEQNRHVILTTGVNTWDEGFDVVVEGDAIVERDDARLRAIADALVAKYGEVWRFDVADGRFRHEAGDALVFEVAPTKVFGFQKGEPGGQTRWRFD